ncbi:MAG TPA: hypothetical protein VK168_07370 [Saprospiraceae bacterium]|nr:hypothetical protein [Saprospiraceae bacterium]
MKIPISLLFLFLSSTAVGQAVHFSGYPVDTIVITSSAGYYHFDKKGTTTGRTDTYTIAFDKKRSQYVASDYTSVKEKHTSRPETSTKKEKTIARYKGKLVPSALIDSLFRAVSSNEVVITFEKAGFDKQVFLLETQEKYIRKEARLHKKSWYFDLDYTTKEENEAIFDGCQNIDTFNLFLSAAFDTVGYPFVTDVWSNIHIDIKTTEKTTRLVGCYPNVFFQPWYNEDHQHSRLPDPILNLNINRYLLQLLPANFYLRHTLEFRRLTTDYIRWYLHRRGILYFFHN